MKNWIPSKIRERITEILPEGRVVPRHDKNGHFYEIREGELIREPIFKDDGVTPNIVGPVYPSVTGKLQILKDEGLINYKMNRAIEYVFGNFKKFTDENIMEHLDLATRVSQDILMDAGDVGTRIHNLREKIFEQWIKTGVRPVGFPSFISPEESDVRVTSALRALEKFCIEKEYLPVAVELLVYSHKLKTAGTLDDLGLMRKTIREPEIPEGGNALCTDHGANLIQDNKGKHTCLRCGYQFRYQFVLMDLKTSNQFKDHYFFQVCLYWWKLWKLLGKEWKPEKCFILKVSKEDGSYKIEDLKHPSKLASFAMSMIKTNEGVEFIKSVRKDNQKVVAPVMQL